MRAIALAAQTTPGAALSALDWGVIGAYLAMALGIGFAVSRGAGRSASAFFLASRRIPVLAAALSVVATSLSAATFLGAPEDAYRGDLTYLSLNLGAMLGALIVALWFVPAFYRANATTVYGFIEQRLGSGSGKACSAVFLAGRLLASGARLYIAAIPVALVAFGEVSDQSVATAIALVALIAAVYTAAGGVAAVIWTDALQAIVLAAAAGAGVWLLLTTSATPPDELWRIIRAGQTPDGGAKLRIIDTSASLASNYSLWTALIGFTLFNAAAYGADQDLAQRLLTCRSARRGAASLLLAIVIGIGASGAFLIIGLLLWARAQAGDAAAPVSGDTRTLFLDFLLATAPAGVKGLAIAGLIAAAMSSLDSALSSMASAIVCDFVRPNGHRRGPLYRLSDSALSRWAVALCAAALAVAAWLCMRWQRASGEGLLPFALGVMVYAYAGLLGVFATAIFTKRGSAGTAVAALVVGPMVVAALQFGPGALERIGAHWSDAWRPSFGWRMAAGALASLGVCAAGRRSAAVHSGAPSGSAAA